MVVRSFEVRAKSRSLVRDLSRDLDRELISLQNHNWSIISVTPVKCLEYEYPESFESTLFVIVASHEEEETGD